MLIHEATLEIRTNQRELRNITSEVAKEVATSKVMRGICTVFVRHTSASLVIQENADPAVLRDLAAFMNKVAPEGDHYEHDAEGPDDMPAHIRSALTRSSESIPVKGGRLALGTWQGIYLWEHRAHPHRREVLVTVMGTHD